MCYEIEHSLNAGPDGVNTMRACSPMHWSGTCNAGLSWCFNNYNFPPPPPPPPIKPLYPPYPPYTKTGYGSACQDRFSTKKCGKKLAKGKCTESRVMKKCKNTCHGCAAPMACTLPPGTYSSNCAEIEAHTHASKPWLCVLKATCLTSSGSTRHSHIDFDPALGHSVTATTDGALAALNDPLTISPPPPPNWDYWG